VDRQLFGAEDRRRERRGAASASAAETPSEAVFQEARAQAERRPSADLFAAAWRAETAPLLAPGRRFGGAGGPAPGSLHDFPRGAEAGTFLHDLLEGRPGRASAAAPAIRRCSAT
jgi:hypothetical protein